MIQLDLFGKDVSALRRPSGSHGSKAAYTDYENFIKKFTENPKTTDECYTPKDVYEAVVAYVGTLTPLEGRQIIRPFFPGGDYTDIEQYPEGCVVIDNPPFSINAKIKRFYEANGIDYFLFANGMTVFSLVAKSGCAVIADANIQYANKALVRTNFVTNILSDFSVVTAPELCKAISECPSQNIKANLRQNKYPDEVVTVSKMQTLAKNGIKYIVRRTDSEFASEINGVNMFGGCFIVSEAQAQAQAQAQARAQAQAQARAQARIPALPLSERERRIVERLSKKQ